MINLDTRILDTLNESELYLCLHIAKRMQQYKMKAWPGLETLCEDTKWDERTVKKWRKSLLEKGYISMQQRPGKSPIYQFKRGGIGIYQGLDSIDPTPEEGGTYFEGGTDFDPRQNMQGQGVHNLRERGVHKMPPELVSKEVISNELVSNFENTRTENSKMKIQVKKPKKERALRLRRTPRSSDMTGDEYVALLASRKEADRLASLVPDFTPDPEPDPIGVDRKIDPAGWATALAMRFVQENHATVSKWIADAKAVHLPTPESIGNDIRLFFGHYQAKFGRSHSCYCTPVFYFQANYYNWITMGVQRDREEKAKAAQQAQRGNPNGSNPYAQPRGTQINDFQSFQ